MSADETSGPATPRRTGVRWPRRLSILVLGTDPGLNRLRSGAAGAVCVAAALTAEFLLGLALGAEGMSLIVFMMMGGMVGMLGANALTRAEVRESLRAAVFFPVALGVGLLAGILVSPYRVLSLAVFVAVMFAAVYIRRFGIDYFFAGFLVWMGYFFADFLHAQLDAWPAIMLAIVVATAVVLALCTTVFRPHPARTVRRIFRSMDARARRAALQCARLIEAGDDRDERRAALRLLQRTRRQVRETALMSDGWAAHAPALPPGWSAVALRHRLLGAQLNLDRLAAASDALSRQDRGVRTEAAAVVRAYALGNPSRPVAAAVHRLLETAEKTWPDAPRRSAGYLVASITDLHDTPAAPQAPPGPGEDPFEPAAALTLGNLPGSVSVAGDVTARGARWNPLARLRLTTRQAIQVALAGALAIVAGSLLSPQRYYWAVIAAFVAFTGTGSRMETFRKSWNRVLGTLVGLVAGIFLANLTDGHILQALVVVVASIFCGFYLVRISYAYMIFFVTIMISQLYGILGMFSDGLLVLRLEETAIGAAIGILVALVVTPVSTRDTVTHASTELLTAVADALDAAGERLENPGAVSPARLDARIFTVDDRLRRLELVSDPLTRQYLWERRPREVRRRLALLAACVSSTRELVVAATGASAPNSNGQGSSGQGSSGQGTDALRPTPTLVHAYLDAAAAARAAAGLPDADQDAHPEAAPEPDDDPSSLPALRAPDAPPTEPERRRDAPIDAIVAHHLVRLHDLVGELGDRGAE